MALWYYGESGRQIGPVDESAIRSSISEGRIGATTLLWREGMNGWLPLAQIAEFSPGYQPTIYSAPANFPGMVRTSGLAMASMICGILGFVACFVLGGIPAVVCGHLALSQINNSAIPMGGRGMAISGLIMGYIQILGMVAFLVILLILPAFSNI